MKHCNCDGDGLRDPVSDPDHCVECCREASEKDEAKLDALKEELRLKDLQADQMRDVVDAACAYESILGFDDLNSAYQSRREVTDAFVKAVGAYKTRLPEKR